MALGRRYFVDLGKALADVHECFIFGFRQDNEEVNRSQNTENHENKEGKGLQCLLHNEKKKSENSSADGHDLWLTEPITTALKANSLLFLAL